MGCGEWLRPLSNLRKLRACVRLASSSHASRRSAARRRAMPRAPALQAAALLALGGGAGAMRPRHVSRASSPPLDCGEALLAAALAPALGRAASDTLVDGTAAVRVAGEWQKLARGRRVEIDGVDKFGLYTGVQCEWLEAARGARVVCMRGCGKWAPMDEYRGRG